MLEPVSEVRSLTGGMFEKDHRLRAGPRSKQTANGPAISSRPSASLPVV